MDKKTAIYRVPVWISGVFDFLVSASSPEEAADLLSEQEFVIDYERLKREVDWDFDAFEIGEAEIIHHDNR